MDTICFLRNDLQQAELIAKQYEPQVHTEGNRYLFKKSGYSKTYNFRFQYFTRIIIYNHFVQTPKICLKKYLQF